MKIEQLNELARCAPLIYGYGLPMEPNPIPTAWDGRRADAKTPEIRDALDALRALLTLYQNPATKVSACVLYYVFVRHGAAARADPQFLPLLALTITPPPKPPRLPLKEKHLTRWQEKGLLLFNEALRLWARTQPA